MAGRSLDSFDGRDRVQHEQEDADATPDAIDRALFGAARHDARRYHGQEENCVAHSIAHVA